MQSTDNETFYYPKNLAERATIIGWPWLSAAIVGAGALLSLMCLLYAGLLLPLLFTVIFAVCTFTVADTSIWRQLVTLIRYLILDPPIYIWQPSEGGGADAEEIDCEEGEAGGPGDPGADESEGNHA